MDRTEEFNALRQELERTPAELEHSVTRARARAKHHKRLRWAGIPLTGAAALFLAFTLLVNVSTSFAAAVAQVPALGPLSAALRWRGSVRTAAERGYVQAVGESHPIIRMGYGLRQSDGSYPILVYVDGACEGDTLTLYLRQTHWNYGIDPLVIPIR